MTTAVVARREGNGLWSIEPGPLPWSANVALAAGRVPVANATWTGVLDGVAKRWGDLCLPYAVRFGVPIAVVLAIVARESGGNANAVSPVGAQGLMQVMPPNFAFCPKGKDWNESVALAMADPAVTAKMREPAINVTEGVRILAGSIRQGRALPEVASEYNAGPGPKRRDASVLGVDGRPLYEWGLAEDVASIPAGMVGSHYITDVVALANTATIRYQGASIGTTTTGSVVVLAALAAAGYFAWKHGS